MVTDVFGALLQELGPFLGLVNLHPDHNNSCLIRLESGLIIQIEVDKSGQFLILGADLGTIPPGKYRENLLREAMKANDMPPPLHGILCFSRKADHLALFEKIPLKDLSGAKLAAEIPFFSEKAFTWSAALLNNEIPQISNPQASQRPGGLFGLIH